MRQKCVGPANAATLLIGRPVAAFFSGGFMPSFLEAQPRPWVAQVATGQSTVSKHETIQPLRSYTAQTRAIDKINRIHKVTKKTVLTSNR